MEQVQLLNDEQIDNIWNIINRDYVEDSIKNLRNNIKNSEKFATTLEEIKISKDYLDKIERIEVRYQNNLKAKDLLITLSNLDNGEYYLEPNYDNHWVMTLSDEDIKEMYESDLRDLINSLPQLTFDKLKVNCVYIISEQIELDIRTRLSLTAVSDIDAIVDDMIKHIDINKYLYIK